MSESAMLKRFGDRVGYSDSDRAKFGERDPRIRNIEKAAASAGLYTIEAEVVESRHCNSGYKVGEKFILDADGNFISKLCPKRLCVYAVSQLAVPVALINERLSEGLDPNSFHFMRQVRCLDVGVDCEGYGGVRMRVSLVPRK
jgi:uncharacterized repeat protein (TIGR04076 family)